MPAENRLPEKSFERRKINFLRPTNRFGIQMPGPEAANAHERQVCRIGRMLVSVYLCKNLNRKRAAAGSESAGDAVLPKEKCGASGKECGAKKRLLEKMPQGAGAFRRGCRGCRKTNAQGRRAPEAFLLTEKTGFAGVERFRVGTTPPRVFDYGQIH